MLLPRKVRNIRPPETISSERKLKNAEKSRWNCSKKAGHTLGGLDLVM